MILRTSHASGQSAGWESFSTLLAESESHSRESSVITISHRTKWGSASLNPPFILNPPLGENFLIFTWSSIVGMIPHEVGLFDPLLVSGLPGSGISRSQSMQLWTAGLQSMAWMTSPCRTSLPLWSSCKGSGKTPIGEKKAGPKKVEKATTYKEKLAQLASPRVSVPSCGNSVEGACPCYRCCPEAELPAEETEPVWKSPDFPSLADGLSELGPFRGSSNFPGAEGEVIAPGPVSGSSGLGDEVVNLLMTFPRDMFVMPRGASWPPQAPGFLDLFSGERGVAKALLKHQEWSLRIDLSHGPKEDVMDPTWQAKLRKLVRLGAFSGAGGGPVCTSFSMAITPAVRSKESPYGLPDVSDSGSRLKKVIGWHYGCLGSWSTASGEASECGWKTLPVRSCSSFLNGWAFNLAGLVLRLGLWTIADLGRPGENEQSFIRMGHLEGQKYFASAEGHTNFYVVEVLFIGSPGQLWPRRTRKEYVVNWHST